MPVKDRNPFGSDVEEPKADVGVSDPFERPSAVVKCPVCAEKDPTKIETRTTPWQILRICQTCSNKWSGGTVGGATTAPIHRDVVSQVEEPEIPDDPRLSGTEKWFD